MDRLRRRRREETEAESEPAGSAAVPISNRATAKHLILRQEDQTAVESDPELDELDAELDQLLEELFPDLPEVPTFEAITSTTTAQFSRGELETEIARLWQREKLDFTAAARAAAQRDTHRGPRATQSLQAPAETEYGRTWAVTLFAADYERNGDIPEINRLMRRGSPFQQALRADVDHVIAVENPSADEMRDAVQSAVIELWEALPESTIGELVVTFSGHGGAGSIEGVDGEELNPADLAGLADFAAGFNIQIVYVLDTCRAGNLINFAQAAGIRALEEEAAELPEGEQAVVGSRIGVAKDLAGAIHGVSRYAYALGSNWRTYRRDRSGDNYKTYLDTALELGDRLDELVTLIDESGDQIPNSAELRNHAATSALSMLYALEGSRRDINAALASAGEVLDIAHATMNQLILEIDASMDEGD